MPEIGRERAHLARRLADVESPAHDTSVWMSLIAWGLLCFSLVTLILLAIRAILVR